MAQKRESWLLDIVLSVTCLMPWLFANTGWGAVIAGLLLCGAAYWTMIWSFGRGFVIHAFLVCTILGVLAVLVLHTFFGRAVPNKPQPQSGSPQSSVAR
jgi:hypothetical protein